MFKRSETINNIKLREKFRAKQMSEKLNIDFENIELTYSYKDYDRLKEAILKGVSKL